MAQAGEPTNHEHNQTEEAGIVSAKVALVIIYNHHQHADNIPLLEKLYGKRFSHIWHLVPVMPGFAPVADEIGANVIAVQGRSFDFEGWIAQGLRHYFREEHTHYFFIHDDLVLNPAIDENNFRDYFELHEADTAFLSDFYTLHQRPEWIYGPEAYAFPASVDALPEYAESLKRLGAHGLDIQPVSFNRLLLSHGYYVHPAASFAEKRVLLHEWLKLVLWRLRRVLVWPAGKRKLPYPLVGGYADIAVVPAGCLREFCRYCEVFAARRLFVAIALPSALALSCKKINTHDHIARRGRYRWPGRAWEAVRARVDDEGLDSLLDNFPDDCLFIHPVKLSQSN